MDEVELSVVVPLYRNAQTLREFVAELQPHLAAITPRHELVLVDDGSPDDTAAVLRSICAERPWVKGVALARNFGQHPAITAGIAHASGRRVALMDGDLQHPPETLAVLWRRLDEGADLAIATYVSRADGWFRALGSRVFWRMMSVLAGNRVIPRQLTMRVFTRPVADAVLAFPEQMRLIAILNALAGFKHVSVEVAPRARADKERSSYTLSKLVRLLGDHVVATSELPLELMLGFGLVVTALAVLFGLGAIVQSFVRPGTQPGWTSIVTLISFLGGITITALGVVGAYVGQILRETKHRPVFVVRELHNMTAAAYRGPADLPAAPLRAAQDEPVPAALRELLGVHDATFESSPLAAWERALGGLAPGPRARVLIPATASPDALRGALLAGLAPALVDVDPATGAPRYDGVSPSVDAPVLAAIVEADRVVELRDGLRDRFGPALRIVGDAGRAPCARGGAASDVVVASFTGAALPLGAGAVVGAARALPACAPSAGRRVAGADVARAVDALRARPQDAASRLRAAIEQGPWARELELVAGGEHALTLVARDASAALELRRALMGAGVEAHERVPLGELLGATGRSGAAEFARRAVELPASAAVEALARVLVLPRAALAAASS